MQAVSSATLLGSAWCPKPRGAQAHGLPGPHTGMPLYPRPEACLQASEAPCS